MKFKPPASTFGIGKNQKFWLGVIAVALIAFNINILAKYGDKNLKGTSVMFGLAVLSLLWEKRQNLQLNSNGVSRGLGTLLIAFVLGKSILLPHVDPLFQITPFLSAIGLGLIASGLKGLKQYLRELMLLLALGIPFSAIIPYLVDLATLTAHYATLILWYLGFSVSHQGVYVILPTGSVEVGDSCSGVKVTEQMLRLAILYNVMFPSRWLKNILVACVAVFIGLTCNAIRVGVLAIVLAEKQPELFQYFHGPGGHLFTTASALVFGLFCYFLVKITPQKDVSSSSAEFYTLKGGL